MTEVLRALVEPFTDPGSRTWAPGLLVAGLVLLVWGRRRGETVARALGVHLWRSPSALLDVQLLCARQLLALLGVLPRLGATLALATAVARILAGVARPDAGTWSAAHGVAFALALFLAWDASRFLLHRAMHRVPLLWRFHEVHHSAEVLTPLTFHRVHPVEALLYEARGALVGGLLGGVAFWLWQGAATVHTVLGVDAIGLVLNAVLGNLRHSHAWIRFPAAVERWLLSPAQHQLHHGAARAESGANFGVWLAVWDRWAGSLRVAGPVPPVTFGHPASARSHGQDLLEALVGPFRARIRVRDAGARDAGAHVAASRTADA
jgi:sterol desaturase/sphingolipid hydroxylase (fatty acid hydroxylase superfamily)